MMALQFTLNRRAQLPLGSQPENQQSLFVEHTSIGWSHGAATAMRRPASPPHEIVRTHFRGVGREIPHRRHTRPMSLVC